jgi:serine/threonine protein kinase
MALGTSAAQVVGSYDLLNVIGEGGMGTVYKARHQHTADIVAIKIVAAHLAKNTVLLKRFEKEYNAARAIDHPNIVRAIDFGHNGTAPYLVMEYVDGESLGQRLERVNHLPESEAIRIISQAAEGLHGAHKLGLIHRDVKPDNILLTSDGGVKVTDLGLVKELDTNMGLTRTGRGLGTPHFMAPEQFRNAKNADARCDIYSLAATLYMTVTGELPFKACSPIDAWMKKLKNDLTPPRQLMPNLSERLDWAIRRAMSPEPDERPANCREFLEDLTGHSTRKQTPAAANGAGDVWYLTYKDRDGDRRMLKGSVAGIRRALKEGSLGDASNVRVSRIRTGPFELLRAQPEFRDLAAAPEQVAAPKSTETPLRTKRTPVPESVTCDSQPSSAPKENARPRASAKTPTDVHDTQVGAVVPHIYLGHRQGHPDWVKWLTLAVIAVASALTGYYLLPLLADLRLF